MSDRGTRALGANGANDQRSAFKTSLFLIDAKMSVSIYTRATNTPFFLSVVDFKFAVFCFSFWDGEGTTLVSDSYPNVFGLCKLACAFNLFLVNSSFEEDFLNPSGRLGAMVLLPIDRMERRIDLSSFCFVLVSRKFLSLVRELYSLPRSSSFHRNERDRDEFAWKQSLSLELKTCLWSFTFATCGSPRYTSQIYEECFTSRALRERERESDRLIRQKYLCLFLCEKVHFFPLGSFQICTKNIRKSFRFHPSSIFFKRTRKKSKSKKIFACLVLLRRLIFGFFFFSFFSSSCRTKLLGNAKF